MQHIHKDVPGSQKSKAQPVVESSGDTSKLLGEMSIDEQEGLKKPGGKLEQERTPRETKTVKRESKTDPRREHLIEDLEADERWVDTVLTVLDAYHVANPGKGFDGLSTCEDLTPWLQTYQPKSLGEVSRVIIDALGSQFIIPESVDPDGAKEQAKARAQTLRRIEEKELGEDELMRKGDKSRSSQQQTNAKRLVESAQGLNGTLNWCPSGFEVGELEGNDRDWYASKNMKAPKEGAKDPRGRQTLRQTDEQVENAFTTWIRCDKRYDPDYTGDAAPEPSKGSFMNCWEGVIFAAFKAGLVSKDKIIEVYLLCKKSSDPDAALMRWLGSDNACAYKKGAREPKVGDILFYGGNEHVAIYKGEGKVLQLWHDGGMSRSYIGVEKKDDHRESGWEELEIGHAIRFAPSPF